MKFKFLALLLLTGTSMFAGTHFHVGVGVGLGFGGRGYYPPAPPVYAYAAPAYPVAQAFGYAASGSVWIPGYYYPVGPRYYWRGGYYARPPYAGAYWVAPRFYGGRYYGGRWGRR